MFWRSARGATVAAFLTVCAVAPVGFLSIMTGFASYDDEGYFLSSLRGYEHGVALYNEIYTQYGPFYWQFMAALFASTGVTIDHDSGRIVTLLLWCATAGLSAATVWRLTRNLFVTIGVAALTLHTLYSFGAEPTSTGHLTALFIAALAFALTLRRAFWAAGILVGCLLLIKVNVGCFAVLGVLLPLEALSTRAGAFRAWRWGIVGAGCIAPIALVYAHLSETSFLEFGLHIALASTAFTLALLSMRSSEQTSGAERRFLSAFVYFVAADVLLTWATSSSLVAIVRGVVTDALRQPGLFAFSTPIPSGAFVVDLMSLGLAAAMLSHGESFREWTASRTGAGTIGAAKLGGGALTWIAMASLHAPLGYPLAPVWLAVLPSPRQTGGRHRAVVLVASTALLQALQAYPVAGSQKGWSSMLLIVVGAILISDGIAGISFAVGGVGARLVGSVSAAAAGFALLTALILPLPGTISAYRAAKPIDLPGAHLIHTDQQTVDALRAVAAALKSTCTTYVSMPGLGSFYLFTGETPPTYLIGSDWMSGIPAADQQKAVDEVEAAKGVCVLRNDSISGFWLGSTDRRAFPNRPLVDYVFAHSQRLVSLPGGYQVAPPQ